MGAADMAVACDRQTDGQRAGDVVAVMVRDLRRGSDDYNESRDDETVRPMSKQTGSAGDVATGSTAAITMHRHPISARSIVQMPTAPGSCRRILSDFYGQPA